MEYHQQNEYPAIVFSTEQQMGTAETKSIEYLIQIETNPGGFFDFTRPSTHPLAQVLSFPSYLHLYPKRKQLQYSLLHDQKHQILAFDNPTQGSQDLIISRNFNQDSQTVWRVLEESEEYELEQGDRIRLGGVELYLKELRHITGKKSLKYGRQWSEQQTIGKGGTVQPLKSSGYFGKITHRMRESDLMSMRMSAMCQSGVSQRSVNEKGCRICFDGATSSANPLFNVCLCSGSVKYVHLECLRQWFRSKTVRMESPHCVYYSFEPMQCQLCHYAISNQVVHQGKTYSLYDHEHMHPPFAQLEHFTESKVLQENLSIDVGRGPHNDLNLNDPSLARTHCQLSYSSQRLLLKPRSSRFGSAVQLNRNTMLGDVPLKLLIDQQLVTLSRKVNVDCCSASQQSEVIVE